jgi:2-polyprenyl-6-methoxyphenol hydroxylase-like FAD-dependent oxidoreductase
VTSSHYDVVIAGGSVAGATLGGLLAGDGLGVLIIEREPVFRERVRGESIHPWGMAELRRLGIEPVLRTAGLHDLPVWQRYTGRVPEDPFTWADVSVDGLPEGSIPHPRMQDALLRWAIEQGAELLRPARVVDLGSDDAVEIEAGETRVRVTAKLIVGADGRHSTIRRLIGSAVIEDPDHHRIGGALLANANLAANAGHEARFPGGRFFALPRVDGLVRFYYVSSGERLAESNANGSGERFIDACAALLPEGVLAGAATVGPVAFFSNANIWTEDLATGNAVLIGDAAGADDPSLGQGLSLVFRDVRTLRDALWSDGRNWPRALAGYQLQRRAYFDTIRANSIWLGKLTTEEGPEIDRLRERVARAREIDPAAGGFALIFARGPEGLKADETARRHFFGEDLEG